MSDIEDDAASSSSEESLVAQYTMEHFRYGRAIEVELNCATTTKGRNIIAENRDSTGLMIWPASHVMCRHLVSFSIISPVLHEPPTMIPPSQRHTQTRRPRRILELGCGVGLVGLVATLSEQQYRQHHQQITIHSQQQHHENVSRFLMVSTDADSHVVNLCAENVARNHTNVDDNEDVQMWSRQLWWGDSKQLDVIRKEAASNLGELSSSSVEDMDWTFDQVIAADVVYPSTSGEALTSLFETVDRALYGSNTCSSDKNEPQNETKFFLLSFVSRDGHRTPVKLLDAATRANYKIEWVPVPAVADNNEPDKSDSYECMGAKLLRLTRGDQDAVQQHNSSLGTDECLIFPGLKLAIEASFDDSSEEEWDAPPLSSDDEEAMD